MKNVTITLDEQTLRAVRSAAAKVGKSVSRYIGDMLQGNLEHDGKYEQSMRGWLAQKPFIHLEPGEKWGTREEIYAERGRIR